MSEPFEPAPAGDGLTQVTVLGGPDLDDPLPARVDPPRILPQPAAPAALAERRPALALPAVQAAAVAAGGFVAGVAVVGLANRRRRRSPALAKGRRGARGNVKAGELLQIVGSRSLLVDVHLLGGRGGDR